MPEVTAKRGCLGCLNLITIVGGAIAGAYYGFNEAKGINVPSAMLYGPAIFGGLIGTIAGADLASDPKAMEEMAPRDLPSSLTSNLSSAEVERARESAKSCAAGCGPWTSGIGTALLVGACTAAGYWVGKSFN